METFVTPEMFETFKAVENIVHTHFKDEFMWMLKDSFKTVMDSIANLKDLPLICCEQHREEYVAETIFYYVKLCFIFETKRKKATHFKCQEGKEAWSSKVD